MSSAALPSILPVAYNSYASVVVPRRLASNTFLVPRDRPKSYVFVDDSEFRWWIWGCVDPNKGMRYFGIEI